MKRFVSGSRRWSVKTCWLTDLCVQWIFFFSYVSIFFLLYSVFLSLFFSSFFREIHTRVRAGARTYTQTSSFQIYVHTRKIFSLSSPLTSFIFVWFLCFGEPCECVHRKVCRSRGVNMSYLGRTLSLFFEFPSISRSHHRHVPLLPSPRQSTTKTLLTYVGLRMHVLFLKWLYGPFLVYMYKYEL